MNEGENTLFKSKIQCKQHRAAYPAHKFFNSTALYEDYPSFSFFFFSYFFPKEKNNSSYILVLHSSPHVTTTIAFRRSDWHISMKLKANVLILYLAVKLQLLFRMEKGLAYLGTSLLFLALLISITKGISFTYKTLS